MPLHKHIRRLSNLLRLAEENHTLDPALLRKLKKKRDSGVQLSTREKSLLERANSLDIKLKEGPAELSSIPAPDEPIWSYFISKEQWDSVPDDKKPLMEEWFQKAYENTTKGREHGRKLNESDFAPGEIVEEGDHKSAVRRYAKSLSLKTKNLRRLISGHLEQVSDQELKKSLLPLIKSALDPLDELDTLLKRVEFSLGEITPQTSSSKIPLADKAARQAISLFRKWGSDLGAIFGEDRQRYMKMSEDLKKVLSDRFKYALREFRSQGMSAEEAAEKAKAVPSIRKMRVTLSSADARLKTYDLILNEMASLYDNSRPMIKSMEAALDGLTSSISKKTANLQEELVLTSSAPNKKVAKQLLLIGQKIKLVRNLTKKLLDKTSSGTSAEQQAAKELEKVIEALLQPLEQAEAMVVGAEKTSLALNKDNYKKLLGSIEGAVDTIADSVEAFSSGYARDVQSLMDKHQRIIQGLTKTYTTRFKEGRDQLMAKGLSKEEASSTLNKASSMQQMVRTLTLAKIKVDIYQELLFGLDGVAGSMMEQNVPKLKEEFLSLKSYLGEGGGKEKAASMEKVKKRLNKVSKRILLLAYLRSKSL